MEYKYLLVEKNDGIAVVTVNREKALNALNGEVMQNLSDCMDELKEQSDIDVVIITGKGRSFVAGADITAMAGYNAQEGLVLAKKGMDTFRKIEIHPTPVIAAVNGFAFGGGCELAMSCDIRIASKKAVFGQPETGLGITPGYGGTQRLPRLVGMGKAKQLIYSSASVTAEEAYRIGLVDELAEPEELLDAAKKLAKQIMKNGQLAVRAAKRAINAGMQMDIDSAMYLEAAEFAGCFATEDQKEGMKAFMEKRKPEFNKK